MHYQVDNPQESANPRVLPAIYVLIFSVSLMVVQSYSSWLSPVKSYLFSYIYNPLNQLITSPLDLSSQALTSWQHQQVTDEEFSELLAENQALRAQLQQYGHFQAENRRLRMLMDSVLTVTDPVLIAELLNTAIDGYNETIVINKGKKDAVYLHQAVIDPYGLVGQVTEVYDDSAQVMLISDARSRVPAYIERNFHRVVVVGNPERGSLVIPWQRHDSDIQIGDKLISSGLGGVYPRGYPIATVIAIDRGNDTSFLKIKLKPIAHLSSMLEVLLLNTRISDSSTQQVPIEIGPPAPLKPSSLQHPIDRQDNAEQ